MVVLLYDMISLRSLVLDHSLFAHIESCLAGSLVAPRLETYDPLSACPQVLLCPLTMLALRHLRSHLRTSVLSLVRRNSAESSQAHHHLFDVSRLKQIHSLENLVIRNSKLLQSFLESCVVFHELEVAAFLVDALHAAGDEFVHHVAENDSILKDFLKWQVPGNWFLRHSLDPVQDLGLLFSQRIALLS